MVREHDGPPVHKPRGIADAIEAQVRHARKWMRRTPFVVIGICVLILVIVVVVLYARERLAVNNQDPRFPSDCQKLWFSGNGRRCADRLSQYYAPLAPQDRGALCERSTDRTRFLDAAALCPDYDDARASILWNTTLRQRGIAVWEPDEFIVHRTLLAKTTKAVQTVSLVCDHSVVPIRFSVEAGDILVEIIPKVGTRLAQKRLVVQEGQRSTPSTGSDGIAVGNDPANCTLIATTAEGSMTSTPFPIIN